MDTEAVGRLGARASNVAAEVLERHGARVEQSLGDTLIALFGFPVAHEDDALRAVRAAKELQLTVEALNDDPSRTEGVRYRSRTGVETGDIVVTGPGAALSDVIGGPVVTAAGRLQETADDAGVIVGPAAQRLLRGAAILKPIDRAAAGGGRAVAWRVLELVSRAPAVPRTLEAPMVGRQQELTRLRSAFRRAIRSGAAARMTIVGDAGVGKSRLANELVASIGDDTQVITQRCAAHGEAFASFPVREAVIEAAGLRGWRALHGLLMADYDGQRIAPEITSAIELPAEPEHVEALASALRRLYEALAQDRPLIAVIEDLHWAGSAYLDAMDHLAGAARGPIFLLCLARPDLIEQRPEVAQNHLLSLEPLAAADIQSLLTERAGPLEPATLRRITDISHGNPLFAEQMLASLSDVTADDVPLTLRGLLTMRLDRLGPGERDLLRGASIIGIDFDRNALSELLPDDAGPFIQRHLNTLERKRFITRTGGDAFRFSHVMIQLTAYHSMTREDRARLHERFAWWLKQESPIMSTELGKTLGNHLSRAGEHRRMSGLTN